MIALGVGGFGMMGCELLFNIVRDLDARNGRWRIVASEEVKWIHEKVASRRSPLLSDTNPSAKISKPCFGSSDSQEMPTANAIEVHRRMAWARDRSRLELLYRTRQRWTDVSYHPTTTSNRGFSLGSHSHTRYHNRREPGTAL